MTSSDDEREDEREAERQRLAIAAGGGNRRDGGGGGGGGGNPQPRQQPQQQQQQQPQQQQQAAPAAAVGGLAAAEPHVTVRIPLFHGEGKDAITIEQWCDTIDRAAGLNRWLNANTIDAVTESLRGRAGKFRQCLNMGVDDEVAACRDWGRLRPMLITRFTEQRTDSEKVRAWSNLFQGKDDILTYYDRVDYVFKVTAKELRATIRHADDGVLSFDKGQNLSKRMVFMQGLNPEVRKWVESAGEDTATIEQCRDLGLKADRALRNKMTSSNAVHGLQHEVGAMTMADNARQENLQASIKRDQNELAALSSMAGRSRGGGGGRGRGGGRGGASSGGGGGAARSGEKRKLADIPVSERDWILCSRCKQFGQHVASECPWSMAEIKKMKPCTWADKPSGPAFDKTMGN